LATQFEAEVTVMSTLLLQARVGVPEITPLELSMLKPGGKPDAPYVYGVEPPVAEIPWL
jgi:hypothetical protein